MLVITQIFEESLNGSSMLIAGMQATVVRFIDLSAIPCLSLQPELAKSQLILLRRRVSSLHMFCPTKYFQEVGGGMVRK